MEKKNLLYILIISILITFAIVNLLGINFKFLNDVKEDSQKTKQTHIIYRDSNSETIRDSSGKFQTTYYPFIKNIKEDGVWKDIKEAKSLKGTGIGIEFLETDENYPIEILDYNYTSITIKLNPNGKIDYKKDIPVKLWKENKTKEDKFKEDVNLGKKQEKELKDKYKDTYENIAILDEKSKDISQKESIKIYDFGFDSILEIGGNSTTITYNKTSTPNVIITCNTTNTDLPPLDTIGTGTDVTTNAGFDGDEGTYYVFSTNTGQYGWCKLSLNVSTINILDITKLNFTTVTDSSSATLNLFHYIYNYTGSVWNYLTNWSQSTIDISTSSVINSGFTNYNSSGYIDFLLQTNTSSTSDAKIDYIYAIVTYDDLIVNSPNSNQEIINNLSTILNTSQSGYNNTIWYSWNNGIKNYTLCTNSNECQAVITFPRQGYYNLTVWANKSDGTMIFKNATNLFVMNETLYDFNIENNVTMTTRVSCNDPAPPENEIDPDGGGTCASIVTKTTDNGLNISDNSYSTITLEGSGNENEGYWQSKFDLNEANKIITNLNITIEQKPQWTSLNTNFYFWNHTSSAWVLITNSTQNSEVETSFSNIRTTTQNDFVNSSGQFFFLAYGSNTNGISSIWSVDYLKLNVSYFQPNLNSTIYHLLSNNTNYTTKNIYLPFNASDDNDYIKNISIYIDGVLNTTSYLNYPITANANNSLNFTIAGISEGLHSYLISATDSDGNITNSSIQTFRIDTTAPTLTILHPENGASFSTGTIDLNYTVSDSGIGLDQCWFRNNSDMINITIPCGTNTTITNIEGTHTVYMWANDTLGNLASASSIWSVSANAPAISLVYPTDLYWHNTQLNRYFNFTAIDSNGIDTCELWGNWTGSWALNESRTFSADTSIDANEGFFVKNISDGYYKWNIWCNDTTGLAGSFGFAILNKTFGVDSITPLVKVDYPLNNTNYTFLPSQLNYTRSDTNLHSCWYSLDNGVTNSSSSCNNFSISASQGWNNWTVYVNDSANNQNSSKISFFVDSIIPFVNISTFVNNSFINYNTSIILNITTTDTNLHSCWYNDNEGANISFSCGNNLSLNLSEGQHLISVYANDTLNNLNSTSISFTTDITYPQILNLTASQIGTSQNVNFSFNVSDLNYNNTFYSIFNSLGNIDSATDENTTIICTNNSICSGTDTLSSFGIFNLTVYSRDKAGNQNSSTVTVTFTEPVGSVTIGGGGGNINIIQSSILSENYTFSNSALDFVLAKGSVVAREKVFYLTNKNLREVPVSLICTSSLNNTANNKINICDYVTFENANLILSANELSATQGKLFIKTPENASFQDKYEFTVLAVYNLSQSETQFAKLSVVSRVPIWGLIYKYSYVPTTQNPYPITPIALFISFLLFGLSIFFLRKLPLTSFLVSMSILLISFIILLLVL